MRQTRQELIKQARDASNERDRWMIFANAVAAGESVSIVRRYPHTLQVVRANGAEGGILNYTYAMKGQSPYVSIHNWEDWYSHARSIEPLDKEREKLREAAFKMQEYVSKIQQS